MTPQTGTDRISRVQERWGPLVFGSLAGAGAFSVVVGLSVWLVALFGLLALVEAVDVMSTMTGDWDAARVFETTTSSSQEDS